MFEIIFYHKAHEQGTKQQISRTELKSHGSEIQTGRETGAAYLLDRYKTTTNT